MTLRRRRQWCELHDASGSVREVLCYPPEVVKILVEKFSETDSGLSLGRDNILEAPEHVT